MQVNSYINLNLVQPNVACTVYAVQGDEASRHVIAQLNDGLQPWTPPAGAAAMVRYAKPDGTVGFYDTLEDGSTPAVTVDGSEAEIILAAQMLTVPGIVAMELNFYDGSGKLTSFRTLVQVEPSCLSDGEIESTDYFSVLSQQIAGLLGATTHPPQIGTNGNWMLWSEDSAQYVDSGYSSVGTPGPAPELQSTALAYVNSDSGTVIPSSGWSDTPPATVPGTWRWTRTTAVFSTGTVESYAAAYQGLNGNGAVNTVNGQNPDASGNVALSAAMIPTGDGGNVEDKLAALAAVLKSNRATYATDASGNAATTLRNDDCKVLAAFSSGVIVTPWVSGSDGLWHIHVTGIGGQMTSLTATVTLIYAENSAIS